jgi:hypothetical protein
MQDEQPSCGKGLATHAALPEKLAALLSAMAGLLENHTRSLPPGMQMPCWNARLMTA